MEDFTFNQLSRRQNPFDLSINFDKDLANPEIYDGFKFCVCSECGLENYYSLEQIRCVDSIDYSIMRALCGKCALDLCGFEMVYS